MGSLRSFERLNQYLKTSPERVFFRFTNTLREEPLSKYRSKFQRGEVDISYTSTPFGIYAYPFNYFFLDNRVKSLSDFFYLLSKGVVKERIDKEGSMDPESEKSYSEIYLAEIGKGAALFSEDARYIRFLVISPNAKVWTIGENDPWIEGSRAIDLYKKLLGLRELTPIYEIIPLSVKKFTPLGPFFIFPSLLANLVYELHRTWEITEDSYNYFEEVLALVFKKPGQYGNNFELALRELLFSRDVEEYEFYVFKELAYLISPSNLSKKKFLRQAQHYLPFTSFIISLYFSMDKVLGNIERIKRLGFYELRNLIISEFDKIIREPDSDDNLFSRLFGYGLILDVAKNFKKLPRTEARRETFLKARREIVSKVVRKISQHSEKQVLYLSKSISSLINDLFSERIYKKPEPLEIISLSLRNSEDFIDQMEEELTNYLHVFYLAINPFALFRSLSYRYRSIDYLGDTNDSGFREKWIIKMELQFLENLSGAGYPGYSYFDTHKEVSNRYEYGYYTKSYADLILKKLGFQVVVDPGYGLIHPNEPVQAVILDDSVLEYEAYFENFPNVYWKTLERLLINLKIFGKDASDYKSAIIRAIEEIELRGYRYDIPQNKEVLLSTLINLYLDFSFISTLLSSLGIGKENQAKVKKALASKMKELSKYIEPRVVKRIMSKSILNFVLDKKKFPPEKMKKAFQEIKKVLSTRSK
jgi:hypothetical protein